MSALVINNFGGAVPKLSPELLPLSSAQIASNCKLFSRRLESWRKPLKIFTPSVAGPLLSIYRMYSGLTDYWLSWPSDVDAVRGPIAGDTTFRLYYTGDTSGQGWPKKTNLTLATGAGDYPHDYLEMGLPVPTTAPTIGAITGGAGSDVTVSYVYTFVSSWGEESAPSVPVSKTGKIDGSWPITTGTTIPGPSSKYSIALKNIYRSYTDASGVTNFYFVAQVALGTATYNDDRATMPDSKLILQGILQTQDFGIVGSDWLPPPTDLRGLCMGNNGIMAGITNTLVCFSVPYAPYAWPLRNQYALPGGGNVSIIPFGSSFMVGTKGRPHTVTGTDPAHMAIMPVERDDMPCRSKRGSTLSAQGALLPTPNGLALVGAAEPANITEPFFARDDWNELVFPDTLFARMWGPRYVGFFSNADHVVQGFILDPTNQNGPVTFLNFQPTGLWTDPETNDLYLILNNSVYKWDADTMNQSQFDWLGRVEVLPKPKNLGAYKVDADFTVITDDFLANQAQAAADTEVNVAILAAVPAETGPPVPANIFDALGSGYPLGYYMQLSVTDKANGGPGPLGNTVPLGGSLLVGGNSSTLDARTLSFSLYAMNEETATMELKFTEPVTDRKAHSLPSGYMSDRVQLRASGNIPVNRLLVASTRKELEQV